MKYLYQFHEKGASLVRIFLTEVRKAVPATKPKTGDIMNSFRKCYVIPPMEKQCLWMSAGILSYQLCDRMFDCDSCPMDQAMRRRYSASTAAVEEEGGPAAYGAGQELPREGFRYSRNHWWAHPIGPRLFRLGLEPGLARALQGIKGIVLPAPHQQMVRGQTCIWLVMDGGTVPLESPLDGSVRTLNSDLVARPHLLDSQPFDDGWLCELESDDAEVMAAEWMSVGEAEARYRSDQVQFLASVTGAMRGRRTSVGLAFTNGGEKLQTFADILGPTRYFALVRNHFGWTKR